MQRLTVRTGTPPSWRHQLLDRPNCIRGWGGLTGVSARRFTQNGLCRPLPVGSPPWGGLGPCPCQKPRPPEYAGLRGEGSTPVPLPPPACPRPRVLRVNLRAIKPSNSSGLSFELRTPDRQSQPIVLRKARFSPKLWTPSIRYGSRNSNVWSCL
jgi:hypothetical protein